MRRPYRERLAADHHRARHRPRRPPGRPAEVARAAPTRACARPASARDPRPPEPRSSRTSSATPTRSIAAARATKGGRRRAGSREAGDTAEISATRRAELERSVRPAARRFLDELGRRWRAWATCPTSRRPLLADLAAGRARPRRRSSPRLGPFAEASAGPRSRARRGRARSGTRRVRPRATRRSPSCARSPPTRRRSRSRCASSSRRWTTASAALEHDARAKGPRRRRRTRRRSRTTGRLHRLRVDLELRFWQTLAVNMFDDDRAHRCALGSSQLRTAGLLASSEKPTRRRTSSRSATRGSARPAGHHDARPDRRGRRRRPRGCAPSAASRPTRAASAAAPGEPEARPAARPARHLEAAGRRCRRTSRTCSTALNPAARRRTRPKLPSSRQLRHALSCRTCPHRLAEQTADQLLDFLLAHETPPRTEPRSSPARCWSGRSPCSSRSSRCSSPTTRTRACRSCRPTTSRPRCPSGAKLVKGNEVRVGRLPRRRRRGDHAEDA